MKLQGLDEVVERLIDRQGLARERLGQPRLKACVPYCGLSSAQRQTLST